MENLQNPSLDRDITKRFLLKFSLPSIIMMIFMSMYSIIDGVFVSQLVGTDALSSINIVAPLITVFIAFATMIGTGGNAIVARKLGEGKSFEARRDFSTLICLTLIIGVVFFLLCLLGFDPMLKLLGSTESIYAYCYDYALTTLYFLPLTMLAILFQILFVTAGKGHLVLIFTLIGGFSNIILDYVFIKIFNLGITGAALATGIGYSITGLFGLIYFMINRKNTLHFIKPHFEFKLLKDTCINGSSEMISALSGSIVILLLNNILMRRIGVDGVAAITIILYLQMLLSAAFIGYTLGISPLISFNYGKNHPERLHKIFKISIYGMSIFSILIVVLGIIKADFLTSIFVDPSSNVYQLSIDALRIFSLAFLFMGINMFASALFTSLSNGKVSAILSFVRSLVLSVITLLILPPLLGNIGIWIAVPVSEGLSFIISIYYIRKYKKHYNYY